MDEYYRDKQRSYTCESTRYKDELDFYVPGRFDCKIKSCPNISIEISKQNGEWDCKLVQKNLKYILI